MPRLILFSFLGFVLGVGAAAQEPEVGVDLEGNARDGRRVFNDRGCYQCHGYEAQGGPGSRLAPDPIPFDAFLRYVRNPAGQMPPYTGVVLSDDELADVYSFLKSIPQPPPLESIPVLNED